MAFSTLTSSDKDAFFALLDEYFASRPEIFTALGGRASSNGTPSPAPPALPPFASRMAAPVAQHAYDAVSASAAQSAASWRNPPASPSAAASSTNADYGSSVGRVAAAAAAFQQSRSGPAAAGGDRSLPPPRPPPRRNTSSSRDSDEYEQPHKPEPQVNKLVPQKKFGDVDVTSGKAFYSTLRNSTTNKHASPPAVAPPIPPAFPQKKSSFAPPPRRIPSAAASSAAVDNSASHVVAAPPPPPPVPRRPQQEEEVQGEWAEVKYDYSSSDAGDLQLQTGDRILVVERTSEDWWTGELDGQRGLFPASYVQMD